MLTSRFVVSRDGYTSKMAADNLPSEFDVIILGTGRKGTSL